MLSENIIVYVLLFFMSLYRSLVGVAGLEPNLSEQGGSCSAQVVRDEQLGVGVDSCWMELPQWLQAQQTECKRNR